VTGAPSARPSEPVELAPSETAGQQVAMAAMGRARMGVLTALKVLGEATADQLAGELGLSVGAVRQQLGPLSDEGLVAHRDDRPGPGRPRRWYCLAPAAETLFPKRYGQLTNQLLGFIEEADPALVTEAFDRRSRQRQERANVRMAGLEFDDKVRELSTILDEDGYLAHCEQTGEGAWRISELNCAILDVAVQHGVACGSELAFIRAVLPEASVERVTHILAGEHACAYEIRLREAEAGAGNSSQ
jgi:DeoR family transcriptional regulator, suf operon transcriptional repressor